VCECVWVCVCVCVCNVRIYGSWDSIVGIKTRLWTG
jgi:hypothetical protein